MIKKSFAGMFPDIANSLKGELWDLLCASDNLARMDQACSKGLAAVSLVRPLILTHLGKQTLPPRLEQYLCFAVRQIMRERGYVIQALGIDPMAGDVFQRAD